MVADLKNILDSFNEGSYEVEDRITGMYDC